LRKIATLYLFLLLACSCSGKLRTKGLPMARMATMDIPALTFLPQPVAASLDVEVQNLGSVYRFQAQVEMDREALVMVGLAPIGSSAFTLTYRGDQVTYEHIPFFNLPLKPDRLLLAYLLLALPEKDLENHVQKFGFSLEQNIGETKLLFDQTPIARVISKNGSIKGGEVVFHHLHQGYLLRIKTLQWETY